MLFESLGKLKRNSIMSAILLITLGIIILICPTAYIPSLMLVSGYTLIILAIVMALEFFTGKKSLMEYIKFTGALLLALLGAYVLFFKEDTMRVLAWMFGLLLVLDGGRTMYHSFTYARRSKRKAWWVLTILSALLMITGILIFANPWWNTPTMLMRVIGLAVLFSATVSGIRLIWTWPLDRDKGGETDG